MEFERRKWRHSHIDVAPLVDVVFNLLLFFVITYNVTSETGIKIRLPESMTAVEQMEEPIVIALTREGSAFINNQPVSLDDIPAVLKQRIEGLDPPSIQIKADQEADVGLLVKVLDGVRLSGCSAFQIVTDRNAEGS
jgi:biopolymer transport protein ExbD